MGSLASIRAALPRSRSLALLALFLGLALALFVPGGASLYPAVVRGAGDGIRVLSNDNEVRFPGDVVFNVEVEGGQADIVEIRLYYRVSRSGVWSYAYPHVSPSRRVEASFNLDFSGASYVPPGTEVEYFYSVTDSLGNALDTDPRTFLYVDGKYRWQTVAAGPLTLYWHDLPQGRVEGMAREIEGSLDEVASALGVDLDVPMRGVIYNSQRESRDAFPNQSRTTTEGQVFAGYAFPENGVFVGVGFNPGLIVHEAAHILMHEAAGSPWARVPAWVNEGFASYVEPGGRGYARAFSIGASGGASPGQIPLRHMSTLPGRPSDIRYFYRKAESVVGYLLEVHGEDRFRDFLGDLDGGADPEQALVATYGFGQDDLDQKWAASLGQLDALPTGGGSFPMSTLGSLLIAFLAMVAMSFTLGGVLLRRVRRRLVGHDDAWDGLSDQEWRNRP